MRPAPEFVTTGRDDGTAASPSGGGGAPRSPWHSPVPYLFGGLAAMLGLIAFALLILACSYWKLSGYLDSEGGDDGADDRNDGGKPGDGSGKQSPAFFEEKILVIMAGDCKPTFLATPIASRAAACADRAGDDAETGATAEDQEGKAPDCSPPGDAARENSNSSHQSGDGGSERNFDRSQSGRSEQ